MRRTRFVYKKIFQYDYILSTRLNNLTSYCIIGVQALAVKCNLLLEADIDRCVAETMAKFGR
jgi:hypothetical protein